MSTVRTSTLLLAVLPFMVASKCRTEPVDPNAQVVDPLPPEVSLQITSVDPNRPEAGKGFRARVIGQGFEDGAKIRIGDIDLNTVVFVDENTLIGNVPILDPGGYDVRVTNPGGQSAMLRAGIIVRSTAPRLTEQCRSTRVFFPLDSSTLGSDSLSSLSDQASCFGLQNINVRIEGHCDERGTTDYNVALGLRRAEVVKRYLVSQGVPPSRISTTSYGEEKPLVNGSNESAWSQNRRAEIILSE